MPTGLKNFSGALLMAATFLGFSEAASAQTFTSTDTPLRIPIVNFSGTTISTINVPAVGVITDVNISMTFNHTFFFDLQVFVESPAATSVLLFDNIGVLQQPNGTYVFDDQAASEITGADVSGGTFSPQGSLSDFIGEDANGTWTLTINDQIGGDAGNLSTWSVILTLDVMEQAFVAPVIQSVLSGNTSILLGSLEDRLTAAFSGGREPAAGQGNPYDGAKWGMWGRIGGSSSDASGEITNLFVPGEGSYNSELGFVQVGLSSQIMSSAESRLIASVFGHYSNGNANVSDGAGVFQGTVETEGGGVGGSLTWLQTSGLYADLVSLFTWQDIDTTAGGATGSTDGETIAGSIELGYKMPVNDAVSVVPQAQLVYQSTSIDDFTDSAGATATFSDADNFEGRFGVGVEHVSAMHMVDGIFKATGHISVVHDFDNDGGATVNGTVLGFDAEGTELLVGGGVTAQTTSGHAKFGFNGDYRVPLNDAGREGFTVSAKVGLDF